MFNKIVIGVAAVGLTLAAAALQPASANYAVPRHAMHAHNYRAPRPAPKG